MTAEMVVALDPVTEWALRMEKKFPQTETAAYIFYHILLAGPHFPAHL